MKSAAASLHAEQESGKPFADLSTEQLRAMAVQTDNGQANWADWTRDMLLAFFHNRFGRYVPS